MDYIFTSSNTNIVEVNDFGEIKGSAPGIAKITITSSQLGVSKEIEVEVSTSTTMLNNINFTKLIPIIENEILNLSSGQNFKVMIHKLSGEKLESTQAEVNSYSLSNLNSGAYIIKIWTESNNPSWIKFIKN